MSIDEMAFEGLPHTGFVIDQSDDPPDR